MQVEKMRTLENMCMELTTQSDTGRRQALEAELTRIAEDPENLTLFNIFLRESTSQIGLFVMTELLAKNYSKDNTLGVVRKNYLHEIPMEQNMIHSTVFTSKRGLIDTFLQVMAARKSSWNSPEVHVDGALGGHQLHRADQAELL